MCRLVVQVQALEELVLQLRSVHQQTCGSLQVIVVAHDVVRINVVIY